MTPQQLASHYAQLTPEERFKLIIAAGNRDDETEQARLAAAGKRIQLSIPDHVPYAFAFEKISQHIYIEMLDLVGTYFDAFTLPDREQLEWEAKLHAQVSKAKCGRSEEKDREAGAS